MLALRRLTIVFGLVAGLAVTAPGTARAEAVDAAKAEELIRQANDQRKQGHDERAVPLLRQAYEIARSARTAGQLGLAEMALGYWVAAAGHLEEALTEERNPWVEKNRPVLDKALQNVASHLAQLRVEGNPDGAQVIVNGNVAGTLPLTAPLRLNEGRVTVEVRAAGHRPATRTMTLRGGTSDRVVIMLEPQEAQEAPAIATVATPPPPPTASEHPDVTAERPGHSDRPGTAPAGGDRAAWRRVLAWSLLGGAVVAGGIGVWQQLGSRDSQSSFDGIATCGSDAPMRGADPRCAALYGDYQSRRTRAYIGYGVAALLAAGATTLFILDGGEPTGTSAAAAGGHFALALAPSGGVLAYGAHF